MPTSARALATIATMLVAACGDAPTPGAAGSEAGGESGTDDAPHADGSDDRDSGADEKGGDGESDAGERGDEGDVFDVGQGTGNEGGDGTGDGGTRSCGLHRCVDTSADAVVQLSECGEFFADFHAPYDEHYECYSGAPSGYLIGDTDVMFAYDDPDLMIIGRWDGGMAQARVTRDASCNITGFADASWQPYAASEPDGVLVKGMTWLDDGTMFLARATPGSLQQLGQRGPGAVATTKLVEVLSVLPPWEDLFYGNESVAVGLGVVPAGFPGEGSLKLIAEKLDTSHWFTVPLVADGTGTYDVGAAIEATTIYPPEDDWGGYYSRGIAWVGPENPDVDVPSVLIPEAWHYTVAIYELDAESNPLPDTRKVFVEGVGMPSGAETDPVSGNNFVFTGRRSQDVYFIRGCSDAPPPDEPRG